MCYMNSIIQYLLSLVGQEKYFILRRPFYTEQIYLDRDLHKLDHSLDREILSCVNSRIGSGSR